METRTTSGLTSAHKVLADPVRVRLLESLWRGPRSAKEMAKSAGLAPDRLYYHLRKLEQARLIRVAEYRMVGGGKVERVYSATDVDGSGDASDPAQVTPVLEAVLEATRAEIHAAGVRAKAGQGGRRHLTRTTVRLDPDQVEDLAQDIAALVARYQAAASAGAAPFTGLWTFVETPRPS